MKDSQNASGSGEFWCRQSDEITTLPYTDDVQFNFPPIVTVMKPDSAIHLGPSIVCIVDAKSDFHWWSLPPYG